MLADMCKYQINLASSVERTEHSPFCPQMDGQMDKAKPVYALSICGGYKYEIYFVQTSTNIGTVQQMSH